MKEIFYIAPYAYWQQTEKEDAPDVSFIPTLTRRRLNQVEKIGLYLAHKLGPLPQGCKIVFASRFGEWQQTIDLIKQFFNDAEMSPAGFSHSVHNATPGVLSILDKSKESYTAISAQEDTISTALIETFCTSKPVLFIYTEEKTPDFYSPKFQSPFLGHGVAFLISNIDNEGYIKVSVETNSEAQKPPSFNELIDFLNEKDTLSINGLNIRKVK